VTVLVLRALGLGDLLTAVPALRGVRRAFPAERVVLATPAALAPLAYATGAVDEVLPACGLEQLDTPAPDVAVNLHGRGPQSHRLLRATAPRRLVGFRCPEAGYTCGPRWTPGEYEVARWCRMLAGHGIDADPGDLGLPAPGTSRPGCVVVHPGAAHPRRRWPVERFAAVAAALAGSGEDVVVTGSGGEVAEAREVAERAGLPLSAVLAGRTDVLGLAGLVGAARLVVCGDTGVAHLATSFGTPSVVLFGPVPPAEWGPPPGRARHVALWPGDAVHTAAGVVDPVLLAIDTGDVLHAAARLLGAEGQLARPSTVPGVSAEPAVR
jgi:ADP-heptose:LPS heptosyltransferase